MIDHKLSQSEMDRIFNIRILIGLLKGIKLIEKFHIIYIISIWLLTIFIIRWFIELNLKFICKKTIRLLNIFVTKLSSELFTY